MALPGPLRIVGKRHVEQFGRWIPSLASFGGAGALGVLYFTDWKLVLRYVPYYGAKFDEKD